jgi:hypothetical protein
MSENAGLSRTFSRLGARQKVGPAPLVLMRARIRFCPLSGNRVCLRVHGSLYLVDTLQVIGATSSNSTCILVLRYLLC